MSFATAEVVPRVYAVVLAGCAIITLSVAAPAIAQTQPELERVVVTGQPLPEFAAPSALPADALVPGEPASALLNRPPNAIVNEAGASSFEDVYNVRGMGNTPNFSKQALTLYIDDVPSSSTLANFSEQGTIDRAVLFRGPQGDYFGKNSEAGVLEIRTPQPDGFRLNLDAARGDYGMWSGHALLSGEAISQVAFVKLEGSYFTRDGFLENTFLNTRPDFQQHGFGRLTLRIEPAPDWEITFSAQAHEIDDGVQRFVPLSAPDPFHVAFDFDGRTHIEGNVESLRVSHAFDFGQVTLITSWREWRLDPYEADFDYSPVPFVRGKFVLDQSQLAEEIRLDSGDEESSWRWRIGLFAGRVGSAGSEAFLFQQFSKLISFEDHNHEAAVFGRSSWRVAPHLEFTIGMRVEYNDESITRTRLISFEPGATRFAETREEWNVQPRLALTYYCSGDLSVFVDSTYGYKSGGFSFLETDPQLARFETERVWLNEIGADVVTSDRRFDLHVTAFVNRIEDYQVERPAIPPDITIFNAPLVVSWGGEVEATARPVKGLELRAGAGYTHSEFRDFDDPFTAVSYRGNRTPFTPEFTVNASARYTWHGLFLQGELLAAGETFYDEANTRELREGAHAQLNGRIGYEQERYAVTVFCDNMTDERYFTQKIASAGIGTPASPRTFGGSVAIKF